MFYVYIYKDPVTNEPLYVGKGTGARAYHHWCKGNNVNKRFNNKLLKLKKENTSPIIEIVEYFSNEDDAYKAEEYLIQQYGRKGYDQGGTLLNISINQRPPNRRGIKHSPEHIKKRTSQKKGVPLSAETRQKISEAKKGQEGSFKGKNHSYETRQKMSKSHIGIPSNKKGRTAIEIYGVEKANELKNLKSRPRSIETREKISRTHRAKNKPSFTKRILTPDGIFDSCKDVASFYHKSNGWVSRQISIHNFTVLGIKTD